MNRRPQTPVLWREPTCRCPRRGVHASLQRRRQRYARDTKLGGVCQLGLDLRIENIQLKRDHLAGLKRRDRFWPRNHPLSFAEMDRAIEIAGAPLFLNLPEEAVILCGLGQRLDFIHRGGGGRGRTRRRRRLRKRAGWDEYCNDEQQCSRSTRVDVIGKQRPPVRSKAYQVAENRQEVIARASYGNVKGQNPKDHVFKRWSSIWMFWASSAIHRCPS